MKITNGVFEMDIIEEILELFVESGAGLMRSRKIPRIIRVIIMIISTAILVGCIIFLITCFIKAVSTIIRVAMAILSLAIVVIVVRGWINVLRR